jgi:hypothetical protein
LQTANAPHVAASRWPTRLGKLRRVARLPSASGGRLGCSFFSDRELAGGVRESPTWSTHPQRVKPQADGTPSSASTFRRRTQRQRQERRVERLPIGSGVGGGLTGGFTSGAGDCARSVRLPSESSTPSPPPAKRPRRRITESASASPIPSGSSRTSRCLRCGSKSQLKRLAPGAGMQSTYICPWPSHSQPVGRPSPSSSRAKRKLDSVSTAGKASTPPHYRIMSTMRKQKSA